MRLELCQRSAFNRRFAVELDDGAVVEAVVYREHTLCLSCQVGCAVGCPFCASGRHGLQRNLRLDEMVGQIEQALVVEPAVRRVTISGVGEPLHNAAVLWAFLSWCRTRSLAASVTTCGGSPTTLRRLLSSPHNGVTISVHAGTEALRHVLVPRGPSLDVLLREVADAYRSASKSRRRKVSLAYLLIRGCNDGDEQVGEFARRAHDIGASVYLYRFNPVEGSPFTRASEQRYQAVYDLFRRAGLEVRRSSLARVEENGGCGTLLARSQGSPSFDTSPRPVYPRVDE